MQRKFKITVEGRAYNVTVEDLTEYGGTLYPTPGTIPSSIPPQPSPGANEPVATAPATAAPAAAAAPGDEVSPLSGVVASVEVKEGQEVKEGDKIMVIEAMKMKTTIYAHHAGKVTSIAVKPGDAVEAGQVLLTIG